MVTVVPVLNVVQKYLCKWRVVFNIAFYIHIYFAVSMATVPTPVNIPREDEAICHHNGPFHKITVYISVTDWWIMGYGTGALWNMCNRFTTVLLDMPDFRYSISTELNNKIGCMNAVNDLRLDHHLAKTYHHDKVAAALFQLNGMKPIQLSLSVWIYPPTKSHWVHGIHYKNWLHSIR